MSKHSIQLQESISDLCYDDRFACDVMISLMDYVI